MEIRLLGDEKLVNEANMISLGKEKEEYSSHFSLKTVLSEHSTLEFVHIIIKDRIRSDVCHQIVRHTAYHPRHVVQSHRPDWTGQPRKNDPSELRLYMGCWNIKAILSMARQRLCFKAMKETREWTEKLKIALMSFEDKALLSIIGVSIVPECFYRGGCPFVKSCGFYDTMSKISGFHNQMQSKYIIYSSYLSNK